MARKGRARTSTPKLLALALAMLAVGTGLGLLLSSHGCDRRPRPRGDESKPERRTPSQGRTHPGRPDPGSQGDRKTEPRTSGPHRQEPDEPRQEPVRPSLPRLALVIDDLGYMSPELVTRLCAQPVAFSVAVLPFQEFTRPSAEIAHAKGKEVMLHLPMEPVGYPGPSRDPGPGAVFHRQSEAEVREAVRKALADIPFRRGVNNHMGSRITPDRLRMGWVMSEIKQAGCFFIDSRTEKDTVALAVAQGLGVPAAQRKVFLDDDKSFTEMKKQWDRALELARKDGQVIIIGHIYPETVAALERLVPASREQVRFVKASELAK